MNEDFEIINDEKTATDDLVLDIHDLLDKAWELPLSGGKSVVDAKKIRELLDKISETLPADIAEAEKIVGHREEILSEASARSEEILAKAEERRKQLVSEQEIVKDAERRAAELESQAEARAKQLSHDALRFADDILKRVSDELKRELEEVEQTRRTLQSGIQE